MLAGSNEYCVAVVADADAGHVWEKAQTKDTGECYRRVPLVMPK